MTSKKPHVLLTILDGWGINKGDIHTEGNAIELARPGFYKSLLKKYPNTELEASGERVGIPNGQIGSSEVGHLNIGAGRIVEQEIIKINKDIDSKEFFNKKELLGLMDYCKRYNKPLHLMGLLSRGGVHSSLNHLEAILKMCADNKLETVYIHAILDGRDTNPKSSGNFIKKIENITRHHKNWHIATLIGRFYAMDRDNRLERTKIAYDMYVNGKGKNEENWKDALEKRYRLNETDEFISPIILNQNAKIKNKDALFFYNFRADRARQIIKAFRGELGLDFQKKDLYLVTMYPYYKEYDGKRVYERNIIKDTLGELISNEKLNQLRIAETEKYAHVTYFFSGERETPFKNEERIIIPSPKVRTYDLLPEMSAKEITNKLVTAIKSDKYNLIVHNFANTDMVGHTGNLDATIKAVKFIDHCLEDIYNSLDLDKWIWIITADHGNSDKMIDDNKVYTAHSLNNVPFVIVTNIKETKTLYLKKGALGNIAPTIIDLLKRKNIKIEKPKDMTCESLITS